MKHLGLFYIWILLICDSQELIIKKFLNNFICYQAWKFYMKPECLRGRPKKQACKQSCIQKCFPDSNLLPGGSCKLRGRRVTTSHSRPVENLRCEPKFSIVLSEKELPPAADCYVLTTLKRRQNFELNIFTPSKKQKFLENLNFWRQTLNTERSDLANWRAEMLETMDLVEVVSLLSSI